MFSIAVGVGLVAVFFLVLEGRDLKERAADDLGRVLHDSLLWHSAALTRDATTLRQTLWELRAEGPGEDAVKRLELRFDVLWNAAVVARSGVIGKEMRAIDEDQTLDALMAFLRSNEAVFTSGAIARGDASAEVIRQLEALDPNLRRLEHLANQSEQARITSIRSELITQQEGDSFIAVAIVVISILLSIWVFSNARRELERSEEERASAARLLETAMSRTRFLTMVSHELRTPMNGVLGMIELMRTTPLTPDQAIFVDHAAASAHAMTEAVEALLVLSDLEDGVVKLAPERFALADLAETVRRRIAPFDSEEGGAVSIMLESDGEFRGDLGRLSQITGFLANYMRGPMAAPICRCRIGLDQGLLVTLEVEDETRLAWEIEAIFSAAKPAVEDLSADALTPVAARNLTQMMGGECAVVADGLSRRRIEIRVPETPSEGKKRVRAAA